MSFKFLLKLCLLCSTAFCFQFKKDCVAGRHFETDRIATSWDIRVWAPREDADARILTLVSENEARLSLRKIDITRTEVHTLFIRGSHRVKNSSSIPGDGIPPGWREFRVTSDSRFKVWVTGVEEPLVDVDDDVGAERVVVRGSNVTINCREPFFIWNVSEDQEATLPLGGPGRYDLAVFSRSPSSPVVMLGDRTRVLSWDPEFSMVTTFASEPRPLPAFVQHNFTIECSQAENHFKCDVLAGQNETLVGSASLPDEIDALSIHGSHAENFIVILRGIIYEEATAGDNSSLEEADGPLVDWLNGVLSYSPLVFNALLVVAVAVLYVKNKKIKEKIPEPIIWRHLYWEFLNLFKNGRCRRSGISQAPKIPEKNPLNPNDEDMDEGAAIGDCGGDAD
ncbi:uncharacterized protein LOC134769943 isoform X2 [Penaeus indicus]|uniref:uncharacterized protein LOC134769943 isoform X2 n=1 Tax=Penaeus indicus TaxID=29960 RepID=UPI00300DAEFF